MGLSIIDKLKLLSKFNTLSNDVQKGVSMKNTTKVVGAIFVFLTSVLQIPDVQHSVVEFVNVHPAVSLAVGGVTALLSLIHNPTETEK